MFKILEASLVKVQPGEGIHRGLKAASPCPAWGYTAAQPTSEGQTPGLQRHSPGPLNRNLASEEAAVLGKQKNDALGKNIARGSQEKLRSEEPLPL